MNSLSIYKAATLSALISLQISCDNLSASKGGGHGSGSSGGDAFRLMFEEARVDALVKLKSDIGTHIDENVDDAVKTWLLSHSGELRNDIEHSHHIWNDQQSQCAQTSNTPAADISLSMSDNCVSQIKDRADAMKLLVHESVHHFGISDELFADRVAIAVGKLPGQMPPTDAPEKTQNAESEGGSLDCKEIAKNYESPLELVSRQASDESVQSCKYEDYSTIFSPANSHSYDPSTNLTAFFRINDGPWESLYSGFTVTELGVNTFQVIADGPELPSEDNQCPAVTLLIVSRERECENSPE